MADIKDSSIQPVKNAQMIDLIGIIYISLRKFHEKIKIIYFLRNGQIFLSDLFSEINIIKFLIKDIFHVRH